MHMELPQIARRIGTIERNQIVYIEEYVLQYLRTYGCENISKDVEISLYGKYEFREGVNIYIIYAVCQKSEEDEMLQIIGESKDTEDIYIKIGSLHYRNTTNIAEESREVFLQGKKTVGSLKGYYIFYDSNEWMKDYLVRHYERKLENKNKSDRWCEQHTDTKMQGAQTELPELTVLSCNHAGQACDFFHWIRMAVVCILIIFGAIAVTTINEHDKMKGFVQTIKQTYEWTEEANENGF